MNPNVECNDFQTKCKRLYTKFQTIRKGMPDFLHCASKSACNIFTSLKKDQMKSLKFTNIVDFYFKIIELNSFYKFIFNKGSKMLLKIWEEKCNLLSGSIDC